MRMRYTPEMDAFLLKHTDLMRKELVVMFNEHFGTALNVDQIKARCLRIGAFTGRTGQLKKGVTPWNKGLKGYCASPETQFKKGHAPSNSAPVGHEYITWDGYVYRKFEGESEMKLKHVYLWEQANGKLPDGHVLIFKDGNKQNCELDNIMAVERRVLSVMNKKYGALMNPKTKETVALMSKLYVAAKVSNCEP